MRHLAAAEVDGHARPVLGEEVLEPVIRDERVRAAVDVDH